MQTELNYDVVFDAQLHFRLLLDAMSRPGKINSFPESDVSPPPGLSKGAALVGFALLNADVSFFMAGGEQSGVADYFLVNTGARQADISLADYIFLAENYFADTLGSVRQGVAAYPEDGATLIASADHISVVPLEGSLAIRLKGPGVKGELGVYISGINPRLLDFLKQQNSEYPLGLDLIITDRAQHLVCLPRSNNFSFSNHEDKER